MTKMIFPGVVQQNSAFNFQIIDSVPGMEWVADRVGNGLAVEWSSGVIGNDGTFTGAAQLALGGPYEYRFTFDNGEFMHVTVTATAEWEFIWQADYMAQKTSKPRVRDIKFGDGYSQTRPDGIHNNPKEWVLNFTDLTEVEATQIELFLDTMAGYRTFLWKSPDGSYIRVQCQSWNRTYNDEDQQSVSATFTQRFM